MNAKTPEFDDLADDDESTLAASGSTVDDIRAEAARIRKQGGADAAELAVDLGEEPTIIRNFEASKEVTLVDAEASADIAGFDPAGDPTTVMTAPDPVEPAAKTENKSHVVAEQPSSLIDGKAPPSSDARFWEGGQMAGTVEPAAPTGKAPVPKWFLATSLLAVAMAVGLVLLVLWALSGSST